MHIIEENTQAFAAIFSRRNLHNVGAETEEDARIQLNRIAFQRKSLWDLKNENLWERSEKRVMEETENVVFFGKLRITGLRCLNLTRN